MPYCKHCGAENKDDVKFCASCGQAVSAEQAPAQNTSATPGTAEQANNQQFQQQPQTANQTQYQQPPMQNTNNPYQQQQQQYQQQYQQPNNGAPYYAPSQSFAADPNVAPPKGSRFAPLSPWVYMGLFLLFSIPCIGFILLLVFSFVGDNENRKNFARGYLLYSLLMTLIAIITLVSAGAALASVIEVLMSELGGGMYMY